MHELEGLVRLYLEYVWEKGEADMIGRFLSPDIVMSGVQATDIRGIDEFRSFHRMILSQVEAIEWKLRVIVTDPPWISLAGTLGMRDKTSGAVFAERFQGMMRYHDGLVVETHMYLDFLSIFEKMGRLPPRTFDRCLAGEVMRGA